MAQITSGLYSILSNPFVYNFFQWSVGIDSWRQLLVKNHIRPNRGDYFLDIGCGTADILAHLPNLNYVGFDLSQEYIIAAKKRFGHRGTFKCEQVKATNLETPSSFDIVLAHGVLHHLNDEEAIQLFELAYMALKPHGRLITVDGVFTRDQSTLARWILSQDRGQNIRSQEGYVNLASRVFSNVQSTIGHKFLRIPHTLIILECTKD